MMLRFLYFFVLGPVAIVLAWLVSFFAVKLSSSFRERKGVWRRFQAALSRRDRAKPLVWFHVASAGEFLQAEPLLRRFREAGWQLAVTLTSVSGQRWLTRVADWPELVWGDLLPWDRWGAAQRLYRGLSPSLVVYVQADLWPGLVWTGAAQGIPQALVVARLAPSSRKLRSGIAQELARDLYGRLALILASTEADAQQLGRLVPKGADLRIGGDPGIETVLNRVNETADAALPEAFRQGPVLVCGSTWPADEQHLLPALQEALQASADLRAVIAPHEPTPPHLMALEAALRPFGVALLSAPAPDARVILVDSVGKLAGLYRAGRIAYVGGAFSTGVHNVAEPAAAGLPVLCGPRHGNSAVAADLIAAGAAIPVQDAQSLSTALRGLLNDPERCARLGRQGRERITSQAGAAQAIFNVLQTLARQS